MAELTASASNENELVNQYQITDKVTSGWTSSRGSEFHSWWTFCQCLSLKFLCVFYVLLFQCSFPDHFRFLSFSVLFTAADTRSLWMCHFKHETHLDRWQHDTHTHTSNCPFRKSLSQTKAFVKGTIFFKHTHTLNSDIFNILWLLANKQWCVSFVERIRWHHTDVCLKGVGVLWI